MRNMRVHGFSSLFCVTNDLKSLEIVFVGQQGTCLHRSSQHGKVVCCIAYLWHGGGMGVPMRTTMRGF